MLFWGVWTPRVSPWALDRKALYSLFLCLPLHADMSAALQGQVLGCSSDPDLGPAPQTGLEATRETDNAQLQCGRGL